MKQFLSRIKNWSTRDRLSKDLEKVKELSEKELAKEELKKQLFSPSSSRKKKQSYRHVRTEKLLRKAGFTPDVSVYRKNLFFLSVLLTLAASVAVIIVAAFSGQTLANVSVFLAGLWSVGFVAVWLLVQLIASFFLDMRIDKRRKEVEEVLPDFLQLVSANIGAGMPIDKALWFAVRPRFGILAAEIERVAKHVLTGEDLEVALSNFTKQYDSPLLTRSINLLLEGVAAGGHIADLLHKISVDIQEQRIIQKELSANVMTYVIFISFAAILAAPILFGLATQLLLVIQSIAGNLGGAGSSGMISVTPDVIAIGDFRLFAVVLLSGTALISSLIIGVITKGDAKEGVKNVPGFIIVSLTLYVLASTFFSGIFGGLI